MRKFIWSYKQGSASAKALKAALGAKIIKHENSRFKPDGKMVINWGSSKLPDYITQSNAIILNKPEAVALASNKLDCFNALKGKTPIPEFYDNKQDAIMAVRRGRKVFCRTKLQGNSGDGIVVAETEEQVVDAKLYTVWAQIGSEYRIHVFNGKVIDRQRKARKLEVPDDEVNWKIRNLKGGFIFARGDCKPELGVEDASIKAVKALGLDFGAVDVVYTKSGRTIVLEVNTACGLEGTTIENYTKAIENWNQEEGGEEDMLENIWDDGINEGVRRDIELLKRKEAQAGALRRERDFLKFMEANVELRRPPAPEPKAPPQPKAEPKVEVETVAVLDLKKLRV